jgi:uncharacterized protein (DUF1778 family)
MSNFHRDQITLRLELRLAPSAKEVIHRAMAVTRLAAGDLAYEGAQRLLEEHQRMVLLARDRDAFIASPSRLRVSSKPTKRHRRQLG